MNTHTAHEPLRPKDPEPSLILPNPISLGPTQLGSFSQWQRHPCLRCHFRLSGKEPAKLACPQEGRAAHWAAHRAAHRAARSRGGLAARLLGDRPSGDGNRPPGLRWERKTRGHGPLSCRGRHAVGGVARTCSREGPGKQGMGFSPQAACSGACFWRQRLVALRIHRAQSPPSRS